MDSAGNSATCRWSCGGRCAGVGGGGAWRPMPAAGRWWSPQASPCGSAAARRESINELIERWRDGDVKAAAVVDKAIEAMVSAIASAINICDVDTVMLGGVWSQFGPEIASHMQGMMRRQVLGYPEVRAKVLMADVTSKPALIGSAAIGLRRFIDNPMRFVSTD